MSKPTDLAPEISVVVPTYNRARSLIGTLDSVEGQTLHPDRFEVIVVNDGSDDDTPERLKEFNERTSLNLQLIRTLNGGPAKARNVGWAAAAAPVVAFVDDDCVAGPGWLEAGLTMLHDHGQLGVVQGRTSVPDDAELGDWTVTREVRHASPFFESHNIFYRRDALAETSGFDEFLGFGGEDTALGWEVLRRGWQRGFAEHADVVHAVDERGLRWQVSYAYRSERNLIDVAGRYPAFRADAFWRPWAFQRHHAYYALGLTGLLASRKWRPLAALVLPYFWVRRPPSRHDRYAALVAERLLVDTGAFLGRKVGAVRSGTFVV